MLPPVREDTLAFHVNQLKWMGYPFVLILLVNLTCVLYAMSRPSRNAEPAVSQPIAAADESPEDRQQVDGLVMMSQEQTRRLEQQRQATSDEVGVEAQPASIAERDTVEVAPTVSHVVAHEAFRAQFRSIGRDLVLSSQAVKKPAGWLAGVSKRLASRPATGGDRATSLQVDAEEAEAESPRESSQALADAQGLMILNPASTGGAVTFLVDGEQLTLEAGETKILSGTRQHAILFHRGGNFGNASHILLQGEFHFAVGEQGWTLVEYQD